MKTFILPEAAGSVLLGGPAGSGLVSGLPVIRVESVFGFCGALVLAVSLGLFPGPVARFDGSDIVLCENSTPQSWVLDLGRPAMVVRRVERNKS